MYVSAKYVSVNIVYYLLMDIWAIVLQSLVFKENGKPWWILNDQTGR